MRHAYQYNLMLGAHEYETKLTYLRDDYGKSISTLNAVFGQTTGLYWVWHNAKEEYLGAHTYRLFWNEEHIKSLNIQKNMLIVPETVDVRTAVADENSGVSNLFNHYCWCHGDLGLALLYGLCHIRDTPITTKMIDDLKSQTHLIPFNMFIAHRDVFARVCDLLFGILFDYYNMYNNIIPEIEKQYGQTRMLDFLAERILHIIYTNAGTLLPGVEVVHSKVIDIPH